ncbi:venom carboxylesterase-6-like [Epargyreus clarus]|uniref:venom carboxylesterase-6-like n=1 Tax=Epargyreus clarus TaxID=520877 RepID=UPI003C2BF589
MYLWLLLCVCALARAQDGPSVNTTQGVVVGNVVNANHIAFYGIPYAGSTAGENRFKAPVPAPNFPGVFHAIENNVICAQPSPRGLIGVEDCLKLNIHTKNLTTPKPVLVWIQGEDFTSYNTGTYSYDRLVQSDLVVVSMNYRLSIFGFLCLGVPEAPGNAGLKDIVQGLKWIQANIAGFGGNPDNVILMGHGSGAAMVDLITLSPLATGLIHKAMALSGSGLAPWAIAYDPIGHAKAVGDKLGYTDKEREDLAKLLTTTELNVLESALHDFEFPNNTVLFGPCIEDATLNPNDTFLADNPINLIRAGNYSDIPYIGANTNREGSIRAEQAAFRQWLERMQANFTEFIQVDLNFASADNATTVVNSIREFYFAQRPINMETIEDFLNYMGDTIILVPVIRHARERALRSRSEVRLFEFAYRGTLNSDWPFTQIPLKGVKHGGILNYLFDFDLKASDAIVRDTLLRRVQAFAYTGNPTPEGGSFTTWLPVTATPHVLYISGEEVAPEQTIFKEEIRVNLNQEEMNFWNALYDRYYLPPRPVSSAGKLTFLSALILVSQFIVRLF